MPEHLKQYQFKKGQSGNPKGRPKRVSFESLVEQILDEHVSGTDTTKREVIARLFIDEIMKRKFGALMALLDRQYPKVTKHEIGEPEAFDRPKPGVPDSEDRRLAVAKIARPALGAGEDGS